MEYNARWHSRERVRPGKQEAKHATRVARSMTWSEMIGRELGHYQIVAELGRGGSARVYKARDLRTERDVAIKIIPNDSENRQFFVQRFQREIEVVRKLNHPNIVAVYDAGETEELVYLVMQCVEGGTLRDLISEGRMEVPLAVSYAVQMAQALHHAHRQGIVHRDVKPSNMLLDADDPSKLLLADFGIAKIQGLRGITKSGTTLGTPEYMSPEQAQGRESDPRSDIYALGCVVYEMLTGQPPFKAPLPVAVLYRHVYERPTYIRSYNSSVPKALCRVVEVALEKEQDARYPTAEHFARALAPFVEPGYEGAASESHSDITLPPMAAVPRTPPANGSPTPLHVGAALPPRESPPTSGPLGPWPLILPDAMQHASPDAVEHADTVPHLPRVPQVSGPLWDLTDADALDALADHDSRIAWDRADPGASSGSARRTRTRTNPLKGLDLPRRAPGTTSSNLTRYTGAPLREDELPAQVGVVATEEAERWPQVTPTDGDAPTSEPPRRRRSLRLPLLVAGLLLVVVSGWLALSATGVVALPILGTVAATPSPTLVPTATVAPTATLSDMTPTVNPQVIADRQAYASFRAVTLGTAKDANCSAASATDTFSGAQPTIYINLCTSGAIAASSANVSIRQVGNVFCPLPISPNNSYACSANYTLAPGRYDMMVTMRIDGVNATARDLRFTVTS
jgi:serine/threonine protein kinase